MSDHVERVRHIELQDKKYLEMADRYMPCSVFRKVYSNVYKLDMKRNSQSNAYATVLCTTNNRNTFVP